MVEFEKHAASLDIKTIVITMILSALGFLTAFQWRDAIKETIDLLVPSGEGLVYTYVAAIFVTVIAVIVTFVLVKLQNIDIIPDKYEERVKKKMKRKKPEEKAKKKGKKKESKE